MFDPLYNPAVSHCPVTSHHLHPWLVVNAKVPRNYAQMYVCSRCHIRSVLTRKELDEWQRRMDAWLDAHYPATHS